MMYKKILVLGSKGMLGQELVRVFGEEGGAIVEGWDVEDIDVTDFESASEKIRGCAPDVIANAVAYNAVDLCETSDEEYAKAMILNAEVPKFLGRLAKELNAVLIHYSTDYVFDGERQEGYAEDAVPNPISNYGKSKYEGEKAVMEAGGKYYIVRLSKLFGKPATSAIGKKSFFEKMIEVAKEKKEVTVVDDEKSCFAYAPDLAEASKALVISEAPYGVYHLPNSGEATWYEAAQELFRIAGEDVVVKPVSADTFPRPAKRPKFSTLLNTKYPLLRPYTEALKEFLEDKKKEKSIV